MSAAVLCLAVFCCASAQAAERCEAGPASTTTPEVVYVTDFELDAGNIEAEPRRLPPPPAPPGPLGRVLPKPPGATKEPADRGRELVDLMATSLVKELTKAGLTARRLTAAEPRPARGWLVRGVFAQVDEGDRMRRAVIGFGAGKTQMQVAVAVDQLAAGVPKPFYEIDMRADSGRMPGAGPMIVFAPAVAGARVAISGDDLERSVNQAAAKIAADVAGRIRN